MAQIILQINDDDVRRIIREEISAINTKSDNDSPKHSIRYLTRSETAAFIHVSKVTLAKYQRLGILVPKKIGGRVLYDYDNIIECIKSKQFRKTNSFKYSS